jgi:hypothetical protein
MATGRVPTTANSPLTAKGDLFGYSTTQARVAVGSDGDTLVADSAATTGLRYTSGVGLVNPVINGGMDVFQRGTSIAGSTTAFSADRWQSYRGVAGSTFSRQSVSDSTNLPNIQYCLRVQRDSGNTATTSIFAWQNMETVNSIPYAGKTITFSFYARAGANYSRASSGLTVSLNTGTGTDQNGLTGALTGQVSAISQTATLTTTWQRFSYSATLNSDITQIALGFTFVPVGTAGAADYYEVTGCQIDVGNVALPFRRSGGTIQGELAACQRYYWRSNTGQTYSMSGAWAVTFSTTEARGQVPLKVTMRTRPSAIEFSNLAVYDPIANAFYAISALSIDATASSADAAYIFSTHATATANRTVLIGANNNTAGYIAFTAEL